MSLRSIRCAVAVVVVSTAPAVPAAALDAAEARTLLARSGFGPTREEIAALTGVDRREAVRRLLAAAHDTALTPPPAWAARFDSPLGMNREERRDWRRREARRGMDLRAWWIAEMLDTPSPITERMTLFWHSHFASSMRKVHSATLMYRQNVILRRHALGRFGDLLHAIAADPAMLLMLDGHRNRKGSPNENFAREIMELFTVGEGHYTERDVSEAARAFTGYGIDPRTGASRYLPRRHDDGLKTVLGERGRLTGDDVIERLLAHPQTALRLTEKLWREFVSPWPDDREVASIADAFRASGYDLRVALAALLASDSLYAPESRGALVKSPVDLVVGSVRALEVQAPDTFALAAITARLGQALFSPPSVRGWLGGEAWIDASTLLDRRQLGALLARAAHARSSRGDAGVRDYELSRPRCARAYSTVRRALRPRESPSDRAIEMPQQDARGECGQVPAEATAGGSTLRRRVRAGVARMHYREDAWVLSAETAPGEVRALLLATDPVERPPPDARGAALLRALLADPAYQLK